VHGSKFMVWVLELGFRLEASGLRVPGLGGRILGSGLWFGLRV
jgi:hypothetical protein